LTQTRRSGERLAPRAGVSWIVQPSAMPRSHAHTPCRAGRNRVCAGCLVTLAEKV
jgi:hypothetical protein